MYRQTSQEVEEPAHGSLPVLLYEDVAKMEKPLRRAEAVTSGSLPLLYEDEAKMESVEAANPGSMPLIYEDVSTRAIPLQDKVTGDG